MSDQRGSALLLVLVVIVILIGGFFLYSKVLKSLSSTPQVEISPSPSSSSLLQQSYQNPFDSPSPYTNPFSANSTPENPFNNLQ